ncbi:MAG: hypothetical protein LH702_29475 [Phormidesmis sp. CAN_BIN44]|nr:hypothetical protein [Phormidesmis sp. CAN_BIN44]
MKIAMSSWARKLLFLLLMTDICFVVFHVFFLSGSWKDLYPDPYLNPYSIETDRGFAEFFQYMKEYWCVLLLGLIVVKKRSPLYLSWMFLFLYILVDDFAAIHEQLGSIISNSLGFIPMLRLRGQDFGELFVFASVGLFLLIYVGIAYRLGDSLFRKASKSLITMLFTLALFGVLVDLLHVMAPAKLTNVMGLLEDGGEMIVISVMTTFIFVLSERVQPKSELKDAQLIHSNSLSQNK